MAWLLLIGVAIVGSTLVGMIGTGSSLIILPTLAAVLPAMLAPELALRFAVGTTLSVTLIGAIAAAAAQHRNGQVNWPLVRLMLIPYLIGGLAGPWVARFLPLDVLRIYIGLMLAAIGLVMLRPPRPASSPGRDWPSHRREVAGVLTVTAALASAAGVASGLFAIPYLQRFNLPLRTIIGTSTLSAALFSLFSTVGYITSGWGVADAPAWSLGFVYLPVTLVMGVAVAVFGPVGVRLARHFNDRVLRLILALFVLGAALMLLFA